MEVMEQQPQNVIMQGREKLNVTGVKEVCSFDDETIVLETTLGRMTVKGEGMHIVSYNTEIGDLFAEGHFHAAVYMSDGKSGGGVLSRIFR